MSLDIDVTSENVRAPLSRDGVVSIARSVLRYERVRNALVSITVVDRTAIARLNRKHLGHTGPTDVISFAFTRATSSDPVIGDIYISTEVARENARAHGGSVREELARLVVHGILHVLGYDHPEDDSRESSPMWRRQERLLRRLVTRSGTRR
jgi:probable rRNA maturation factor